jgi:hypothetical protein
MQGVADELVAARNQKYGSLVIFPDELDGLLDRMDNDDICTVVKRFPDVTVAFLCLERTNDFFIYTFEPR